MQVNISDAPMNAVCDGHTNDAPAFTTFNTTYGGMGLNVELTIDPGKVCCFKTQDSYNSLYFAGGFTNFLLNGYGVTLTSSCDGVNGGFYLGTTGFFYGTFPPSSVGGDEFGELTNTVMAGASCVTLTVPAKAVQFVPGLWGIMSAIDIQGYGEPPNFGIFEYVKILSSDDGTGIVCFTEPLVNTYLSTYPLYNSGSTFNTNKGGPAHLFPMDTRWGGNIEFRGVTLDQPTGTPFNLNQYHVTFRDVTFTGACVNPSSAHTIFFINVVDDSHCSMEPDKLVENITISGGSWHRWNFQSMSIHNVTIQDGVFFDSVDSEGGIGGTPRTLNCADTTIPHLIMGPVYGAAEVLTVTNCNIASLSNGLPHIDVAPYVLTDGVITNATTLMTWCVPGAKFHFVGSSILYATDFTITGLTSTGGEGVATARCETTLVGSSWPDLPGGGLPFQGDPAPLINFSNSTGSATVIDLSQAGAQNKPIYTYSSRTYTCAAHMGSVANSLDINSPPVDAPIIWGVPDATAALTVTVTRADTNAMAPGVWAVVSLFGAPFVSIADPGGDHRYYVGIDLTHTGTRVMSPSAATGSVGSDSLANMSDVNVFGTGMATVSPSVVNNDTTCPVVTVTWQTSR